MPTKQEIENAFYRGFTAGFWIAAILVLGIGGCILYDLGKIP